MKIKAFQQRQAASGPLIGSVKPPIAADIELDEEIMCPLTGEMIERNDVDGLCDMYERLKPKNDAIYSAICEIRRALLALTEGDTATRRVRGEKHVAKVELAGVTFEQKVLKELWEEYPKFAEEFMRIDSIGVKMREYSKIEGTSSDNPEFLDFRDRLTNANQGQWPSQGHD